MTSGLRRSTTPPSVLGDVDGAVATITFSNESKLNALNAEMWAQISDVVPTLTADPGVRLLVLRGAGECFSAGADLSEVAIATESPQAATRYCHTIVSALHSVANCVIPTVAAVDGLASGGGVELAVAADHRILTVRSAFQLPFARLGVVPDSLTLGRLKALAGPSVTQWMLLRGDLVDAQTCLRNGLADELVGSTAELQRAIDALADSAAQVSAQALRRTRLLLRDPASEEDISSAALEMVSSFLNGDVQAAAHRFLSSSQRQSQRVPETP